MYYFTSQNRNFTEPYIKLYFIKRITYISKAFSQKLGRALELFFKKKCPQNNGGKPEICHFQKKTKK